MTWIDWKTIPGRRRPSSAECPNLAPKCISARKRVALNPRSSSSSSSSWVWGGHCSQHHLGHVTKTLPTKGSLSRPGAGWWPLSSEAATVSVSILPSQSAAWWGSWSRLPFWACHGCCRCFWWGQCSPCPGYWRISSKSFHWRSWNSKRNENSVKPTLFVRSNPWIDRFDTSMIISAILSIRFIEFCFLLVSSFLRFLSTDNLICMQTVFYFLTYSFITYLPRYIKQSIRGSGAEY